MMKSIEDLEQAYKDIDNGRDIYVQSDDGLITKILNQQIANKIYDSTVKLSARDKVKEEKK